MKTNEMFNSNYLKAGDLAGRRVEVTMDSVEQIELGEEKKWLLTFKGKEKGLVLNKTNANMIEEITGSDDTDRWIGKSIVIYPTKTDYQGKRVDCIRVDYPKAAPRPEPEPSFSDSSEEVPF